MKIASFTQTYGNERILELLLLKHDNIGNYFRNNCDIIIFSFHNCPKDFIEKGSKILNEIYEKNKLKILIYNDISYLESIRKTLKYLKDNNFDYILQIQDDQHGINTKENTNNITQINDCFTFLKNNNIDLLHIFSNEGNRYKNNMIPLSENKINDTIFYCYDTRDFKYKNMYSWNDGTYFGKVTFIDKLFNLDLPHNVWNIEFTLKTIFDNNKLFRWGFDKEYFKASNLHGKNVNNRLSITDNLHRFFGELSEWETIKIIIEQHK